MLRNNTAQYLSSGSASFSASQFSHRKLIQTFVATFLAAMCLLGLLPLAVGSHIQPASAVSDDEMRGKITDLYKDYAGDAEGENATSSIMNKFYGESADEQNNAGSFAYVLKRLFTPGYMNNTEHATAAGSFESRKWNCNLNDPAAGTPVYHNCDVPNVFTEFLQDMVTTMGNTGAQNAEVQSAKLNWAWFGLPSSIPDTGVPENPAERTEKFTAMEIYGYNLRYTSYAGEWDRIKVQTEARALSNFGLMDHLKLAGTSVTTGIVESMDRVATGFIGSITTGDFIGAIGGFYTNAAEGFVSGGLNTVLDTSDLNVFNTNAWYRVGYGDTIYNGREMTSEEISAQAEAQILGAISSQYPENAKAPADLRAIKNVPKDPLEAISSCIVKTDQNGSNSVWSKNYKGFTEDECRARADASAKSHNDAANAYNKKLDDEEDEDTPRRPTYASSMKWDPEGTQELETLVEWKQNNDSFFQTASKYNVDCTLSTNESNRASNLATFKNCWNGPNGYSKTVEDWLQQEQETINSDWFDDSISPENLQAWIDADPNRNFNAPWNRFICIGGNGEDLKDSRGISLKAYNTNGDLNPACEELRPPIQNGFFGNGYPDDTTVPMDTRHPGMVSIVDSIFNLGGLMSMIANIGLIIAGFMTRISNTIINLSFSPILETLGLDDIVVNGITGFRDGIFFPLVLVVLALGAVTLLVNGIRQGSYGTQMMSALMMALTFVTGVILMTRPAETVKAVDTIPAQMEALVIGSIFNISADDSDPLCTASGTNSPGGIRTTINQSTRTLMCETWRTFLFNPWIAGQFGTEYENLNAKDSGAAVTMQNSNASLVGDAETIMGGGVNSNNWALYQLDVMNAGTSTDVSRELGIGSVDPDFYRIVDMQAGPNNGAASDGTYFDRWSGKDSGGRLMVGILAPLSAAIGGFTILVYSIAKIQIAFVTTLMVLLLPVMFLIGVHPTMGRSKLKQYFGTLAGLIVQRIVLVVILAVFFLVIVNVGQGSSNYLLNALVTMIVCIVFLYIRKPMLDGIFKGISSAAGGPIGARFIQNPAEFASNAAGMQGGGIVGNTTRKATAAVSGAVTGAVGGYIAGGLSGAKISAKEGRNVAVQNVKATQRRRGYRPLEKLVNANNQANRDAGEKLSKNPKAMKIAESQRVNSKEYNQYLEKKERFDTTWESAAERSDLTHVDSEGRRSLYDEQTKQWIREPQETSIRDFSKSSASQIRRTNKIVKLQEKEEADLREKAVQGGDAREHEIRDHESRLLDEEQIDKLTDDDLDSIYQEMSERSRANKDKADQYHAESLSDNKHSDNQIARVNDTAKGIQGFAYNASGQGVIDRSFLRALDRIAERIAAEQKIREEEDKSSEETPDSDKKDEQ